MENVVMHRMRKLLHRRLCSAVIESNKTFGFLFDIDGVFLRGRSVLPEARGAFRHLLDRHGKWRVPAVFVTNAGNSLSKKKAETLSNTFNCHIDPDQIIMSHSPLNMFTQFHKKYVLICGQGPIRDIATNLGFTDVVTMDELLCHYPHLDVCDHNRRMPAPCAFERYNRRIDAVVMFGEPLKWESSLQILLDILMTNGQPYDLADERDVRPLISPIRGSTGPPPSHISRRPVYPHIPVLACNTDFLWMSEAPQPRLAHGSFLLCLEALYEKLSGRRLLYTVLVGKPSEITYHYAEYRLNQIASRLCGLGETVNRLYCVGDNPQTDIYGANMYNRYLESRQGHNISRIARSTVGSHAGNGEELGTELTAVQDGGCLQSSIAQSASGEVSNGSPNGDASVNKGNQWAAGQASSCESILVLTGVFREKKPVDVNRIVALMSQHSELNYNHRDFPDYPELKVPTHVADNIEEAVLYVYRKQGLVSA